MDLDKQTKLLILKQSYEVLQQQLTQLTEALQEKQDLIIKTQSELDDIKNMYVNILKNKIF